MLNDYDASKGQNVGMKAGQVEGDFAEAIKLAPRNAYLYYDRGNFFAQAKNYGKALADYSQAIQLDTNLAEAYFNRGVVYYYQGNTQAAQRDFSKAGELGLYNAYALSKQLSKKK